MGRSFCQGANTVNGLVDVAQSRNEGRQTHAGHYTYIGLVQVEVRNIGRSRSDDVCKDKNIGVSWKTLHELLDVSLTFTGCDVGRHIVTNDVVAEVVARCAEDVLSRRFERGCERFMGDDADAD